MSPDIGTFAPPPSVTSPRWPRRGATAAGPRIQPREHRTDPIMVLAAFGRV